MEELEGCGWTFSSRGGDPMKGMRGGARLGAEGHSDLAMRWLCLPLSIVRPHPSHVYDEHVGRSSRGIQYGNLNRVCGFGTEFMIFKRAIRKPRNKRCRRINKHPS